MCPRHDASANVCVGHLDRKGIVTMPQQDLPGAILCCDLDAVETLLDEGADPNAPDGYGRVPLHHALSSHCRIPAYRLLLDRGADPRRVNEHGRTMLHFAAGHSDSAVEAFLALGLDPNATTVLAETPMFFAQRESCDALLAGGAQPRFSLPGAPAGRLEEAVADFEYDDPHAFPAILWHLDQLDDDGVIAAYQSWNVPRGPSSLVFLAASRLVMSDAVASAVLEQGILHPCPSGNRWWIEPVIQQKGRSFVIGKFLEAFASGDEALQMGVPSAQYWARGGCRWTFLGPDDRFGSPDRAPANELEASLYHAVMDRFLDGARGSLAHTSIAMISLAHERRDLVLDRGRLAACRDLALASDDSYVRNRAQIMAGERPLLKAIPPRVVDD